MPYTAVPVMSSLSYWMTRIVVKNLFNETAINEISLQSTDGTTTVNPGTEKPASGKFGWTLSVSAEDSTTE